VQRPAPLPVCELVLERGGLRERALGVQRDDGVVRVGGQPLQHVLDVVGGGELAGAQGHPEFTQRGDHPNIVPPSIYFSAASASPA
jgi:hypothetical protein